MAEREKRCETCRWWEEGILWRCGECRRHSPPSELRGARVGKCWPITHDHDWCGDWTERNAKDGEDTKPG